MHLIKYLALDLHIATITFVVMSVAGRVLQEGFFRQALQGFES